MGSPGRRKQAHSGPVARRRASRTTEINLGQTPSMRPICEEPREKQWDKDERVELGRHWLKGEELDGGYNDDQDNVISPGCNVPDDTGTGRYTLR